MHTNAAASAAELLALPSPMRRPWLLSHPAVLSLELIEALKARSDAAVASDPQAALDAVHCAELAAALCSQPLAPALAAWARGNWQMLHDPGAAVAAYRSALQGYRRAGDTLSVARLLTNLVFPLTEQGELEQAERAANEARPLLASGGETARLPLLVLEQNAGWLLHNRERFGEALAAYERALELAYVLELPERAVDIQVNRTLTLERFGRLDEEEATLLAARAQAERLGRRLIVARIDLNLGELYSAQGRLVEALRRLQAAQAGFAALDNAMELGSVLLAEADLFSRLGALPEARSCYQQARERFAAQGMQPQVGIALLRGAIVYRRMGEYATSARLLHDAAALWTALSQAQCQALVRLEQAELALAQRDTAQTLQLLDPVAQPSPQLAAQQHAITADACALRYASGDGGAYEPALAAYRSALDAARSHGDRSIERRALGGLGRLLLERAPLQSQAALEAALQLDEATRRALSIEELKAGFHQQNSDLLAPLLRLAVARGATLDALAAVWRVKGGPLRDLLSLAGEQDDPQIAASIADVRRRLALQRWRLALEAGGEMPDAVREQRDPQTRELEDELRALRRRRLGPEGGSAPADIRRTLGAMHADVLLEYVRCDAMLWALRATPDGDCRVIELAPLAKVAELLDDLELSMQHAVAVLRPDQPAPAALLDECLPLLQRAYTLLIAPCGPLPDAARVLVAPCSPLFLIPFGALHDGRRFLAQRCELGTLLSGALLDAQPAPDAADGVVVLGASADGQLAGVHAEAAAIAAVVPDSELLIDQPGALAQLMQRSITPRVLHLAAHSVLREDAPIFSALRLAGELLSVEQCYELPLSGTQIVVLSGCTTNAGLDTGGALLAFQSALFAAGAGAVLSSLWPISDWLAVAWMQRLYTQLAAGATPAAAARAAQRELLGDRRYAHPALWAAFVCTERSGFTF